MSDKTVSVNGTEIRGEKVFGKSSGFGGYGAREGSRYFNDEIHRSALCMLQPGVELTGLSRSFPNTGRVLVVKVKLVGFVDGTVSSVDIDVEYLP